MTFQPGERSSIELSGRWVDSDKDFDTIDFGTGLPADADLTEEATQAQLNARGNLSTLDGRWTHTLGITYLETDNETFSAGTSNGSSDAVGVFEELVRREPANSHWLSHLGEGLADRGKLDEAIAVFRRQLEIDPNAVIPTFDVETFRPMDTKVCRFDLGLPIDKTILVFVGNVSVWHGVEFLLSSFEQLCLLNPDVMLYIVGGSENGHLGKIKKALSVVIVGDVSEL